MIDYLWYIAVGLIVGYFANQLTDDCGWGLIINLIIGSIGGSLGGWALTLFDIRTTGIIANMMTATVGAIVLLWIAALIRRLF